MSSVPKPLRARIDAAANELISVAEKLGPDHRALADWYAFLGGAILKSHYKKYGGHYFEFEIPAKCDVHVGKGNTITKLEGPALITVFARSTFHES